MMLRLVVVLSLLIPVLVSCSSSKKTMVEEPKAEQAPKPDWVTSRPMRAGYFIGIAVVDKRRYPNSYAEEARKLALQDIASEIEVDIESTSILFSFERANDGFQDEYRSYSRMTTNKNLRNFQLEDIYETDEKYFVYYSLSKQVYQRDKSERMERALDESKRFVGEAENLIVRKRFRDAFVQYMRALQAVEEFAGESLRTNFEGEEVFWSNALPARINAFSTSLSFADNGESVKVLWGLAPDESALTAVLNDPSGGAAVGIPVRISYSEGFIRPRVSLTNVRGEVVANLNKIREKKGRQMLTFTVDLVEMFNAAESDPADAFMERLIKSITAPMLERTLVVEAPRVFVNYSARLPSGIRGGDEPESAAVERLNRLGFRSAPGRNAADLIFDIQLVASLIEPMADMHRSDLDVRLTVTATKDQSTVFNETLPNIRGVQLSDAAAVQNGIYKTADELNEVAVPRFHRFLLR